MSHYSWEDYEAEMFLYAKSYTITEFLGCAKYKTMPFDDLDLCADTYRQIRQESPNRRVLVYAVCHPPNRALPVSLPIAEHRLP